MGSEQIFATLYVSIITLVILFQFCLIYGAPWGQITQGWQYHGALPMSRRVAAAISIFLLIYMAASVTSAAGLNPNWADWTAYLAIAIQALSAILNWITPSKKERQLWAPVTSIMLLLAVLVVI